MSRPIGPISRRTAGALALRGLAAALVVACLTLAAPTPAHAAAIPGRVVMGTAGAALPDGLRITVLSNNNEGVPEGQPTFVPVGAGGEFTFEADPAKGHLVGLFYKDVAYSRVLEPGSVEPVELTIYETTTDASVVSVASDSMTVLQSTEKGQGNVLEVLQLLRYHNNSDRAFIGSDSDQVAPDPSPGEQQPAQQRQILKLPVPESAYDLAPADAANNAGLATSGAGRLVTTSALTPGENSVAYLFKVQVPRTGWQLRREVYHPTEHADLLIGTRLNLTAAPGFELQETRMLGGESYNRYRSGALNPGSVIEADIGFPEEAVDGIWIGFGFGVVVLGVVLAVAFRRMRRRKAAKLSAKAAPETAGPAGDVPSREELIEQVAELDERFESGGLEKAEYESTRASLLERLGGRPDS